MKAVNGRPGQGLSDMNGYPQQTVTRDAQGRTVTQHTFPTAEAIARDRAERAASLAGRDPFAHLPAVDDEEM